jgi:hypothetical protein
MRKLIITKDHLDSSNTYIGQESVSDFDGSIEISEGLGVVTFNGSVSTRGYIWARVGSGIKAGRGITAGEGITAGLTISAGLRIFAGLCMWRKPTNGEMEIRCERLVSGQVCYGNLIEIPRPRPEPQEPSLSGKNVSVTLDGKTYKAIIQ